MDSQTRTRIVRTAEDHFARNGFFATSMRQLTRDAGVNVAAIHYHFGSKEILFIEVLNQCILPFVKLVQSNLHELAHGHDMGVEELVSGFAAACVQYSEADERQAVVVTRLLSRLMLDEYRNFREILAREYRDIVEHYFQAFQRCLPDCPEETVRWRMHFALSTMFNAFAGNDVLKALASREWVNARNPAQVAHFVVPFVVAGLKAPVLV